MTFGARWISACDYCAKRSWNTHGLRRRRITGARSLGTNDDVVAHIDAWRHGEQGVRRKLFAVVSLTTSGHGKAFLFAGSDCEISDVMSQMRAQHARQFITADGMSL